MKQDFDWLSLDKEEEVLWSGEPIMKSIYPAILTGVVLFPLAPFIIIPAYLYKKNTDFVVSSEGLYKKTGVLSRNVQKIGFDKVQNISFSQGVFGKYFGYGNVEISTAGGSGIEMRFGSIEDPKEVQQLINRQIKTDRGDSRSDEGGATLDQLLEEMKKMRKAVERMEKKI